MSSPHSISSNATFQQSLAALPLATYRAGETVLAAGSATGRLLILKEGAVTVVKEGVEIAKLTEPGEVLGELSALLDQPHTAEVRALEDSQFHVASTAAPLMQDPIVLLYVARGQAGEPSSITGKTVDRIEEVLGASGGNLVYGGYPYDPFTLNAPTN